MTHEGRRPPTLRCATADMRSHASTRTRWGLNASPARNIWRKSLPSSGITTNLVRDCRVGGRGGTIDQRVACVGEKGGQPVGLGSVRQGSVSR